MGTLRCLARPLVRANDPHCELARRVYDDLYFWRFPAITAVRIEAPSMILSYLLFFPLTPQIRDGSSTPSFVTHGNPRLRKDNPRAKLYAYTPFITICISGSTGSASPSSDRTSKDLNLYSDPAKRYVDASAFSRHNDFCDWAHNGSVDVHRQPTK